MATARTTRVLHRQQRMATARTKRFSPTAKSAWQLPGPSGFRQQPTGLKSGDRDDARGSHPGPRRCLWRKPKRRSTSSSGMNILLKYFPEEAPHEIAIFRRHGKMSEGPGRPSETFLGGSPTRNRDFRSWPRLAFIILKGVRDASETAHIGATSNIVPGPRGLTGGPPRRPRPLSPPSASSSTPAVTTF